MPAACPLVWVAVRAGGLGGRSVAPFHAGHGRGAPATRLFAPNPYVVRPGTHRDRLPNDDAQASPSRGDLQNRPPDSERTTIEERCRYLAVFQTGYLLLSNRCRIGFPSQAGEPGLQTRKNPFVSDALKAAHQAADTRHLQSHRVSKRRRGSTRQYGCLGDAPLEKEH